jgi:hypothetical protein
VVFAPDGQTLASTGMDGTVRLWDVVSRQPIGGALRSHPLSAALRVAFSPDMSFLVSVSTDSGSSLNLRRLNLDELLAQACDIAGRNLIQAEWHLFMPEGMPYRKTCEQFPEGP